MTEHELLSRANVRNVNELPNATSSNTDNLEEKRAIPRTAHALPNLVKRRNDKELPR
jgi:hypothetical protein